MITRRGICKCELCENEFEWIVRTREKGEYIVVGEYEDIKCPNVEGIRIYGGHLIATGYCPSCGMVQRTPLVDEEIGETGTQ